MMKTHLGGSIAACALLAACSRGSEQPTAAAAPALSPPSPPAPAASFDGTYVGTVTRVRTPNPRACVPTHHATIHIENAAFTYTAGRNTTIHAMVEPGGAFSGTADDTTMKGQVAEGKLTGTTDGINCGYTLELTKH